MDCTVHIVLKPIRIYVMGWGMNTNGWNTKTKKKLIYFDAMPDALWQFLFWCKQNWSIWCEMRYMQIQTNLRHIVRCVRVRCLWQAKWNAQFTNKYQFTTYVQKWMINGHCILVNFPCFECGTCAVLPMRVLHTKWNHHQLIAFIYALHSQRRCRYMHSLSRRFSSAFSLCHRILHIIW